MTITYVELEEQQTKEHLLWWQQKGLSYTVSGYGKKIPTNKLILFKGRWRRIYCHLSSNIGTLFIIVDKKEQLVR